MADDRDQDRRRSADGDATVQIPAELLSILPPPAEAPPADARTPTPPPPGPSTVRDVAPLPAPPPPDPIADAGPVPPARTPVGDDTRRGGGFVWLIGALVVVVLFVGLCYVVVAKAEDDRPQGSDIATAGGDASTTTPAPTTTAATPSTQAPADVSVVVLNGSGQPGWAGENVEKLAEAGYTGEATDAAVDGETSTIYIADESLRADGAAVATAVGLPDAPIEIRPEEPLGKTPAADGADVVVVLGTDSLG